MNKKSKLDCEGHWDSDSISNYTSSEDIKKRMQRSNWSYLRRHPELRAIIRVFLHEVINEKPDNIYEFSAALFNCNNSSLLVTKINQQLKWLKKNLREGRWSEYDGEMLPSPKGSMHSLLSQSSISNDKLNILRYAKLSREQK